MSASQAGERPGSDRAAKKSWRPAAKAWAAFFAVIFLAMTARVFFALESEFIPARHLDVNRSAFRKAADGRAQLTLVLLHAAGPESIRTETLAPEPGNHPLIVRILTSSQVSESTPPEGETQLVLDLPAVPVVRVLDMRWDHPREHPQGHEFTLEPAEGGA